jgi:hypothetical protein
MIDNQEQVYDSLQNTTDVVDSNNTIKLYIEKSNI